MNNILLTTDNRKVELIEELEKFKAYYFKISSKSNSLDEHKKFIQKRFPVLSNNEWLNLLFGDISSKTKILSSFCLTCHPEPFLEIIPHLLVSILKEKNREVIYHYGLLLNRFSVIPIKRHLQNNEQKKEILIKLFESTWNRNDFGVRRIFEVLVKAGGEIGWQLVTKTFGTKEYGSELEIIALESLECCPLKKAENELIRRIKEDPFSPFRIISIDALFFKKVSYLIPVLKDCFIEDLDLTVKTHAAVKLSYLKEDEWLQKMLDSQDKQISLAAAIVLYFKKNRKARELIKSLKRTSASEIISENLRRTELFEKHGINLRVI